MAAAWATGCALLVLLLAACDQKPAFTPPPPPKVTVAQPVLRGFTDSLELTGTTQAVNTVQLRARVEGYLEQVLFKDGETVKKDQLLFLIQQNTYVARLQQAEGSVQTQKAALEHAKTELARFTDLFNKKAAAQTDVENWRYQRDAAQAALMTAEAQRDQAKLDLGYTRVSAPFTGWIDRRLVDPGNLVGSGGSTVLVELRQTDPLYVYFNVSESDISRLMGNPGEIHNRGDAPKQPVYMGLVNEEGYPHEGYVDFASPAVSTTTGTLLVRGVFPNPDGKMLPGQFARVKAPAGKEKPSLLVPMMATAFDQLGSYVMVVNDKNIVERRNVKRGASSNDMYVIEDGLKGDDWVIVRGLPKAVPGKPVTPERQTAGQPGQTGGEPQGASPSTNAGQG
jgi:RND family efflux transporter MFP subunit